MKKIETPQPQAIDLYTISAKLLAIGELIKFRGGEPSLEDELVNYGVGEILTDLAGDLRCLGGNGAVHCLT
jgi:hypothetical protein